MKTLTTILLTLLTLIPALAGAPERGLEAPLVQPAPLKAELKRGPQNTRFASYQGLTVRYQEGRQGPEWSELTGGELRMGSQQVQFSLAPAVLSSADGRFSGGAQLQLKVPAAGLEINHTSHFGSLERHLTRAVLSVNDQVGVQALHTRVGDKVNTRVGPSLKLTNGLGVWYGFSTSGGQDLMLLTGNLRF